MSVLFCEFRKILRPGVILALIVLAVLFYNRPIKQSISLFRNSHPAIEEFDLAVEATREFGVTLEQDEAKKLKEKLPALEAEVEMWIMRTPVFAEAGIHSLADYRGIDSQDIYMDPKKSEARGFLVSGHCDYVGSRLSALENMIEHYENRSPEPEIYEAFGAVPSNVHRVMERQSAAYDNTNIIPRYVVEDLGQYAGIIISWMCLSVLVLVAPMAARDSLSGIAELQASSREGRKLYKKQLAAVAVSALLLTFAEACIAGVIYSENGTAALWNNPVPMSFCGTGALALPLTYGGYVLMLVLLAAVLIPLTAVLAFVVSRRSRNTITMTLKLVVMFFFMNHILKAIFQQALVLQSNFYLVSFYPPFRFSYPISIKPGADLAAMAVVFMTVVLVCVWMGAWEKRRDF